MIKAKEMDLIMDEIYNHFDENHNQLIEQDELKLILQVPANFLDHIELYKNLNKREFSEIFEHYDRDSKYTWILVWGTLHLQYLISVRICIPGDLYSLVTYLFSPGKM